MRVGESLREMDDAEYFSVISEQDPDFSSRICKGLTLNDLDAEAIGNMRRLIADKQKRPDATTVPLNQLLKDLLLIDDDGNLKYATLLLLGKSEAINRYLPQANVVIEYRNNHSQVCSSGISSAAVYCHRKDMGIYRPARLQSSSARQ